MLENLIMILIGLFLGIVGTLWFIITYTREITAWLEKSSQKMRDKAQKMRDKAQKMEDK